MNEDPRDLELIKLLQEERLLSEEKIAADTAELAE